jgi:tellurite resistance protein TerC
VYLSTGLALILAFIAVELVMHFAHQQDHSAPAVSAVVSLAVVAVVITASTIAGFIKVRRDPGIRAHAEASRQRKQEQPVQRRSGAVGFVWVSLTAEIRAPPHGL